MYLFYVDECGRPSLEDKSLAVDPWFVMAAVGIHSNHWLLIDAEITRIKKKYFPAIKPLKVELKSTNIRSAGGKYPRWPFSELKPERLRDLVEELYAIYDHFALPLFGVTINRAEHKAKYTSTGHRPDPPYQLAFRMLVERIDWFLENQNRGKELGECEFGFVILDEYVGQYKVTRSNLLWYQESGTFAKRSIDYVKEVPFFNVSDYSQLLSLPDLVAYNIYHRFRYDKPDYPFYQRIKPHLYRRNGNLWGYGLKVFPDRKAPPDER
ncbi:MAG: hypothetical protein Fur0043_14150 [Anaerolineales bacterium]